MVRHHTLNADGLARKLGHPCLKDSKPQTSGLAKDLWEIPRKKLTLSTKLGEGQFGEVYKGLWKRKKPVAIKSIKSDGPVTAIQLKAFLLEAEVMKDLIHKHLVQLYGVCSKKQPIYIITEFAENGALLQFLQSKSGQMLEMLQLLDIGVQVADGMAYLEQKNYIHRDLAARNILLDGQLNAKIADFGLARTINNDIYQANTDTLVPIKWTAPEALFFSTFSIKSDVWSFGILLTELVTFGATPYPGE
jgi:serine/threonine protein kinase